MVNAKSPFFRKIKNFLKILSKMDNPPIALSILDNTMPFVTLIVPVGARQK